MTMCDYSTAVIVVSYLLTFVAGAAFTMTIIDMLGVDVI